MTYVLTEEHGELATAVRQLIQRHPTTTRIRPLVDAGESPLDRDTWQRMTAELGLAALLLPESEGGSDATLLEAAVVLEEAGSLVDAGPLLPALVATALLRDVEGFADVRAAIADGTRIPAVVWLPDLDLSVAGPIDLGGVLFGADAQLFVVLTDTAIGVIDGASGGIRRQLARPMDLTRTGARVIVDDATVRIIPLDPAAADLAAATVAALVAAELVGVVRGALAQLRDYAAVRGAFGRIIGSFQSVKHRLADIAIVVEIGETLVRAGIAGLAAGETADALAAAWYLARRAVSATGDTVRLHGGIGYTWDYDAHLWFRRARGDQSLLGSRGRLASRLDRAIGLAASA
jgi:alkylation response protein AidB-like acyl-CoA dehydrogenase